jgi:hypothetical protein
MNNIWAQGATNWQVVIATSLVHSGIFVLLFGLVLLGGVLAAPDAMVPGLSTCDSGAVRTEEWNE